MKRILLLIGIVFCSMPFITAQEITVGPEAGINLGSMAIKNNGVKDKAENVFGVKLGGIFDIGFTDMISLQPGLFYSMKGYKNEFVNTISSNGQLYQETETRRVFTNNIELPVNLQVRTRIGNGYFFAGGGPYAAVIIGGQVESERATAIGENGENETTQVDRRLRVGNTATDDIKRADVGLGLNAGFLALRGLFVRANTQFGFANLRPEGNSDNSFRNFTIGFSVGYLFGNKRE